MMKFSESTDEQLLAAIVQADERAMEAFYQRYSGIVYQFAYKTLLHTTDANEVMNEVMMEIWKKAGSFTGKSKVKTWLLSITHHKAVDAVRRKSKHDADEILDDSAVFEAPNCDLDVACQGTENLAYIKQCMNGLKNGHRQVVYLTFFEGLSYPDIAKIIGVPDGTVKTRMLHAKSQLMSCLSSLMQVGASV